jgi:hypothetical protein
MSGASITTGCFRLLRRLQNLSVCSDSEQLLDAGVTCPMSSNRELGSTNAGCRIEVSTESRNEMCPLPSYRSLITLPSVSKDMLIALASSRATPSTPDRFVRSLPARSTREMRAWRNAPGAAVPMAPSFVITSSTVYARVVSLMKKRSMKNRAWLRELVAFILVDATLRWLLATSKCCITSRMFVTSKYFSPVSFASALPPRSCTSARLPSKS